MLLMSGERILFVVEGSKSEPTLIRRLNRIYGISADNYLIFSYKNTIHELIDEYIHKSTEDEYIDFKLFLREHTDDPHLKKELNQKFALIYIIFDYEPHYPKFSFEALQKIKNHFCDSLDNGLILLSYPMIESFRHLKEKNDPDFFFRSIKRGEEEGYKERVGHESGFYDVGKYNINNVNYMISMHLKKLNYLTSGNQEKPTRERLEEIITSDELLKLQYDHYQNNDLPVISTVFYYLIDYFPWDFYDRF